MSTMPNEIESKQVGGVVVEAQATPIQDQEKQGSICCGCCCDFRRAVIVISIIEIVAYVVQGILAASGNDLVSASYDEFSAGAGSAGAGVTAIGIVLGIAFGIFQMFAALRYNLCMLGTCLVFQLIGIGYSVWLPYALVPAPRDDYASVLATNTIGTIAFGVLMYIYPTAGLILEIKAGTMSAETYPREAHSCCCEPV